MLTSGHTSIFAIGAILIPGQQESTDLQSERLEATNERSCSFASEAVRGRTILCCLEEIRIEWLSP